MNKLSLWFAGLKEREKRVVVIGAAALAVLLLVGGVLLPLHTALANAERRGNRARADLTWMRLNAPEIRSGALQMTQQTGEPPVVLVDRTAREAGLAGAIRGTQPSGNAGVRVQLEAAPFDTMINWLGGLDRRYGLAVESITIDRAAKTGTVNANVTFTQPQR